MIPNGSSSDPPATTADAECGLPSEGGETESDSGGAVGGESKGSDLHATEDTTEVRIMGGGYEQLHRGWEGRGDTILYYHVLWDLLTLGF